MFQKIWKWKWIIAAPMCFLLLSILPATFFEHYYSNGFFLWIRKLFDNTFCKLPFPAYYIFLIINLLIIIKWFLYFFREKPQTILQRILNLFSFAGFMITLFFVLWGFNYGRVSLEEKLQLNVQPLTQEQLISETTTTIEQLYKIRESIKKDTNALPEIVFINNIEDKSRTALNTTLQNFNYSYSSKIRGRLVFEDMFLAFGIGGQYLPYVGEGNVDEAVYYSKKPFYLMHEMAHGNGFTEEATCNFLAYVSCENSNNVALQYSGEINYLTYLLAELKSRDENEYNKIKEKMPHLIQKDLEEIRIYYEKHTFKTAQFGDALNNSYLKLLGIKEGVKNYDKMILLIYAWKQNNIINSTL